MSSADEGNRPDVRRAGLDRSQPSPPRPKPWKAASAWNTPDVAPDDPGDPARPLAALVSFHYLRRAVRRHWLRCAMAGVLGLLIAAGFLVVSPALPTATTTLWLSHDERVDPAGAIATDLTLLTTHTVAERTVQALGLSMSPDALMKSVTPVATGSSQVLQLTMTGPTDAEAVRRLRTFTTVYLQFRAQQVTKETATQIEGYDKRIDDLTSSIQKWTNRIESLTRRGASATNEIGAAYTERSALNSQLSDIQRLRQQTQLQRDTVVKASTVSDGPVPLSGGRLRHLVLVLASGLIVGLALGFVLVVLNAILSDRLWLRVEVASALDAPVPLSVRRLAPLPWFLRSVAFLPWVRRQRFRREAARQLVAHVLEGATRGAVGRPSVGVVCLGNSDELRFGVIAAAVTLERAGRTALIVDLTASGVVAPVFRRLNHPAAEDRPDVFRPTVVPSLSRGPADLEAADWDDVALARSRNAVTFLLADLDPAVGLDHLTAWTDDVVVAVTAGRSSVELVRTAGELVRSAGLRLRAAVLLRAAQNDVSSGGTARDGAAGAEAGPSGRPRPDEGTERSMRT
jgi:capsular polysaccharide biosynthesis protein